MNAEAVIQYVDTSMPENTVLKESKNGIVSLVGHNSKKAWEVAKDVVDYPVELVQAFYRRGDRFVEATGESTSGRPKHYNLVLVDKYRNGNVEAIAAVTNQYGTVRTTDVYADLEDQLNELKQSHKLVNLYVTGNGGAQSLLIEMEGMDSMNGLPDDLRMRIRVDTSVDATKSHTLVMVAHNKTGETDALVYGTLEDLQARHTRTIDQRTVDFVPKVTNMIRHWNDVIIPTMILINDEKFSRELALELVEQMAKEAGIGERRRLEVRKIYETDGIRTNVKEDTLYKVHQAITQYIDDETEDKPELRERFRVGLSKSLQKQMTKRGIKVPKV